MIYIYNNFKLNEIKHTSYFLDYYMDSEEGHFIILSSIFMVQFVMPVSPESLFHDIALDYNA